MHSACTHPYSPLTAHSPLTTHYRRSFVLEMLLHCADTANPTRPEPVYRQWAGYAYTTHGTWTWDMVMEHGTWAWAWI